jgi:hypothetical protein
MKLLSSYSNVATGGRMKLFYRTLKTEWTEQEGLPSLYFPLEKE